MQNDPIFKLHAVGRMRALKYISKMRGVLYYTRSIPKDVQAQAPRPGPIQKSLKTKNLDIAMSRRDALAEADDRYWRSLRALKIATQSSERLASVGYDSREQAVRFKDHWLARIHNPSEGEKPLTRAGAVRELQDLQFIWQSYADEYQWTDRFGRVKDNPFHDLKKHFPAPPKASVHDCAEARVTFSTNIIREKWLENDGLKGTNEELRCVLYTLVETGCNPLELLHLTAEKIHLDHSTPHILIQPSAVGVNRNIVKNNARVRAVPLVGIALAAMRRHPKGFVHYYDKGNAFRGAANKFLLENGLRTKDATVYSLRHEYTLRMRNGGVPEHIQRHIVGHASDVHGDYGAYPDEPDFYGRLSEMAKFMKQIALPFDESVMG